MIMREIILFHPPRPIPVGWCIYLCHSRRRSLYIIFILFSLRLDFFLFMNFMNSSSVSLLPSCWPFLFCYVSIDERTEHRNMNETLTFSVKIGWEVRMRSTMLGRRRTVYGALRIAHGRNDARCHHRKFIQMSLHFRFRFSIMATQTVYVHLSFCFSLWGVK